MRKIQFGCGQLRKDGWENYDMDVPIDKPLPPDRFQDNSTDYIFAEMVCEHVPHQRAWEFFDECLRILKPGGVVRIVVPDFVRNWREMDIHYRTVNGGVTGAKTDKEHARSIIFGHGHQSVWTCPMLECMLEAIGFKHTVSLPMSYSNHEELRNCEEHWRSVGKECASVESGCVEGTKP